jgi:biopolymer transport protein ExbB
MDISGTVKFYVDGGWWMHPILVCSAFGCAIAAERIIQLSFRYSMNANAFMAQIQKLVMANNIDRAIKLCNTVPSAVLPRVMKAALTRANKGEVEIMSMIEESTLEVVPLITKRISMLQVVANIATLLGLLGTIVGLIDAFAAVATAPPDQKAQMLTAAISIAMNTTAFGLIVAIPLLAVFAYLNSLAKRLLDEIDTYSVKLANLLIARGKAAAQAA